MREFHLKIKMLDSQHSPIAEPSRVNAASYRFVTYNKIQVREKLMNSATVSCTVPQCAE